MPGEHALVWPHGSSGARHPGARPASPCCAQEFHYDPLKLAFPALFRLAGTDLCLNIWGGNAGTLVNPYTCIGSADNELWNFLDSHVRLAC